MDMLRAMAEFNSAIRMFPLSLSIKRSLSECLMISSLSLIIRQFLMFVTAINNGANTAIRLGSTNAWLLAARN